jgi:hypothetical protein
MNTTDRNTEIANFMGYTKEVYFPAVKFLIPNISEVENAVVWIEDINMRFHKSWDWLMPVIEKCYDEAAEEFDAEEEIGDITHALLDCDINETYKAVLRFLDKLKDK